MGFLIENRLICKIESMHLPRFTIIPLLWLSCLYIKNGEYFWVMAYNYSGDGDYVQMTWNDDGIASDYNCMDYEKYQLWFNTPLIERNLKDLWIYFTKII